MARVAESLRRQVYDRAQGICEYCQTQELIVINMHIDHIVPLSAGGKTELENLCLSCISCNGAKHKFQMGIDPASQLEVPLFNPRAQFWSEHFAWNEDGTRVLGQTEIGRATVSRLRMNRDRIVRSRRRWVEAGMHPPKT
ncbi:MAG: HNH endonuclease signature motif containing protein [Chloroflexi bacterium]|nr:HNH endonuclease signature motif containing protein [Chloroflexota bacterium]